MRGEKTKCSDKNSHVMLEGVKDKRERRMGGGVLKSLSNWDEYQECPGGFSSGHGHGHGPITRPVVSHDRITSVKIHAHCFGGKNLTPFHQRIKYS